MSTDTDLGCKESCPGVEPWRLVENEALSYAEPASMGTSENLLIHGENLLALKALGQEYAGKVKCAYLDPPYNTGAMFEHYNDRVGHTDWLTFMRDRLEVLHSLLADEGSIWVSIDDNECHYLKVMMDEVFGRPNYVGTIIWQKMYGRKNLARHFSQQHEYILVYAKNAAQWSRNLLPRSAEFDKTYSNPDNDPRGAWKPAQLSARNYYSRGSYEIISLAGKRFLPPKWRYWLVSQDKFLELVADNRIWWGNNGTSAPRIKRFLSEVKQGVVPTTLWLHQDAGNYADSKIELRALFTGSEVAGFLTPKPEKLLKCILEVATNPGDIVLDPFLGSGTTCAVAHKMGRRWIGIECGEQAVTYCAPRLRKVVAGEDSGGVSKYVAWERGGGFRFFTVSQSDNGQSGQVKE
jgi:adenine-specific DNA-methyltransferase